MSALTVPFRMLRTSTAVQVGAGLLAIDAVAAGSLAAAGAPKTEVAAVALAIVVVSCVLYLAAFIKPVYMISLAVFLTMFSGNWRQLGFPTAVSPDRFFFVVGIGAFLLRDPATGERRVLRFSWVHVLLLLAAGYAIASAIGAHTLFSKAYLFPLIDRFGLVPFVLFFVAPAVYATERDRRILLTTLVVMAAYLAWIATAEGLGLHALIWPRYILKVILTSRQTGRARGPFGDSSINGIALFCLSIACVLAARAWPTSRWRWVSLAVAAVCVFDELFTLQRSVWIGGALGVVLMMLAAPRLRRFLPVALLVGVVAFGGAIVVSSSLRKKVFTRVNDQYTVWDRYNLDTAAERMFLRKPLTGWGWGTFQTKSIDFFKLSPNFPFTAVGEPDHSVILSNLAELGLIGTGLWAAALIFGVGGAIVRRGPPELWEWRIGLIGVAVMWLTVANFTPLIQSFPNQLLWLWAGIAWPLRDGIRGHGVSLGFTRETV